MIKKNLQIILLFFVLVSNNIFAQNIRFLYNYISVRDSIKKDHFSNEIMVLEINTKKKQSIFSALKKIKSDSVMSINNSKGIFSFPDLNIRTDYIIEKKLDNGLLYFYTPNYNRVPVQKVEEIRKLDWQILEEKKDILSYSAQKAVAKFAGREWIAWFTTKIPISDGPYKFQGLPGLIIKLYDSTHSHDFELLAIEKSGSIYYKLLDDKSYVNAKSILLKNYIEMIREYQKDPMKLLREKVFRGEVFFDSEQEKIEYLKEQEIIMKKEVSQNNNTIELNNSFFKKY